VRPLGGIVGAIAKLTGAQDPVYRKIVPDDVERMS